jgi:carboxymethylenebutenolidase
MLPEAYGSNPHNRDLAQRFAKAGFVTVLPDLYYHRDGAWQAYPYEQHEHVEAIRDALDHATVLRDLGEALQTVAAHPAVDGNRIAVAGFSIGGRFAHLATLQTDVPVRAGAFVYQCAADAEVPGSPSVTLLAGAASPEREALAGRFSASGHHEVYVYPEARYGFMRTGEPVYEHGVAADAWHRVLALFEHELC